MNFDTIDHTTLSRLAEAGSVRVAHVIGQPEGWGIMIKYGAHESTLTAQRSRQPRLFRKMETLVTYLREVGITQFDVDARRPPSPSTNKRPDLAEAMKLTHEAAAYDRWFRDSVEIGRQQALKDELLTDEEMEKEALSWSVSNHT